MQAQLRSTWGLRQGPALTQPWLWAAGRACVHPSSKHTERTPCRQEPGSGASPGLPVCPSLLLRQAQNREGPRRRIETLQALRRLRRGPRAAVLGPATLPAHSSEGAGDGRGPVPRKELQGAAGQVGGQVQAGRPLRGTPTASLPGADGSGLPAPAACSLGSGRGTWLQPGANRHGQERAEVPS